MNFPRLAFVIVVVGLLSEAEAEAWNGDFRPLLRAEADALLAGDWI